MNPLGDSSSSSEEAEEEDPEDPEDFLFRQQVLLGLLKDFLFCEGFSFHMFKKQTK